MPGLSNVAISYPRWGLFPNIRFAYCETDTEEKIVNINEILNFSKDNFGLDGSCLRCEHKNLCVILKNVEFDATRAANLVPGVELTILMGCSLFKEQKS
jgi:hypothetical protein